ncbi:MAG TPA: pyridoxal 5'-phosphate synthase glutaminase subunit PdxT, partial [Actinomycetota bacterium]|nr:pyridoxal 5'-phosphate synthase glutaminase subunit PdxT [Actinomycetota bacterium]
RAVVLEEGNLLAASFHPELVRDTRLHRRLLERVG